METGQLIAERFHLLDNETQAILGCAALLGYRPSLTLLAACTGVPMRAATEALEQARCLDLVVRETGNPTTYRFRHALIQDAIRQVIGLESARWTHALIAKTLEEMPNRSEHLEALVYHWSAAGDDARASTYRELAVEDARRLGV